MNTRVQEILDILQEECAEVIQNISKCRRFGLETEYLKGDGTQREQLVKEIGDVLCMVDLLMAYNVLTEAELDQAKLEKSKKLAKWSNIYK